MSLTHTQKAYLQLHTAIVLWGFSAILGDLITLDAIPLVWWRVLITSISVLFLIPVYKEIRRLSRQEINRLVFIGVLIGSHWILFFASIKYANPSVALICMATGTFFTALVEPLLLKQRIRGYEIALGLIILPGMLLVVGGTQPSMFVGIVYGVLSALLAAIFTVLNKKNVEAIEPKLMTFVEMSAAWMMISLILPILYWSDPAAFRLVPSWSDLGYLVLLAIGCTTLAFTLSLYSLKYISAYTANLSVNLEPVYGIIMAAVFLDDLEELNGQFYIGCGIIILAVFIYPFIQRYFDRPSSQQAL